MKFIIPSATLQRELAYVQGTVERKNTIPVLANILLESLGDTSIRLTGTDLDVTIQCDVEVDEVEEGGALCINARKLFDIARYLPEAPVRFGREENDWATIKCARSNFRLPGVPRDRFVETAKVIELPAKIKAGVLRVAIERSLFAITKEEGRYTLAGANIEIEKGNLLVVTTDGHRLAYVRKEGGVQAPEGFKARAIIPLKALRELLRLLAGEDEKDLEFGLTQEHIYFRVGSRLLISRMLSGQFPNYEMVLPKAIDLVAARFQASEARAALRRVSLMTEDRGHGITLQVKKSELLVSSRSAEEGEARDSIAIDYTGPEMVVGFNVEYLLDFIDVIGDKEVALDLKDPNSQAQLRPAGEDSFVYKYVVMPMRV